MPVINGIDCGDERELSQEEWIVLLKIIRERMKDDSEAEIRRAERLNTKPARDKADAQFIGVSYEDFIGIP
jgi:hypothetical protein